MFIHIAVIFLIFYLRLIGWTSRIKYYGEENLPAEPFIYVFWHRRLALLGYSHRARAINVLHSTSRDGEIIARTLKTMGFRAIRGTASKSAQARKAAMGMLRTLGEKKIIAVTPDGPNGPPLKVKKGIPYIASKSGCPVVPVGWAVKKKKVLSTWDSLVLPLPFNRAVVVTGKAHYVNRDSDIDVEANKIAHLLNEVNSRAQKLLEDL